MDKHFDNAVVADNTAESQYEISIDGQVAFLAYERAGDRLILIHTEVPAALEGHGLAGKLAKFALEDARVHHLRITPLCTYVASYLRRHQEYLDLVDPIDRARVLQPD